MEERLKILGISKWNLIELNDDIGLPYLDMDILEAEKELDGELLLDEADRASKETDVRYHHKEVFSKVRESISKKDSTAVAQEVCSEEELEEMLLLQEIDKGINDMEACRGIGHDEAMCIIKEKI